MVMTIKKGSDKAEIDRLIEKLSAKKEEGVDAYKHCGVIKLKEEEKELGEEGGILALLFFPTSKVMLTDKQSNRNCLPERRRKRERLN